MKPLRTAAEEQAGRELAACFEKSADSTETKLETFPRYARRKTVTRFITLYELFKRALPVKGSVVECGVFRGFGLMTWAHLSAVLEPANLTRRIYGFDSFEGFPAVSAKDANSRQTPERGTLRADSYDELGEIVRIYDADRFLGHVDKVHLVKGDVLKTIPGFVQEHPHLVVSLLFLDLDSLRTDEGRPRALRAADAEGRDSRVRRAGQPHLARRDPRGPRGAGPQPAARRTVSLGPVRRVCRHRMTDVTKTTREFTGYAEFARAIRGTALRMVNRAHSSHIGGALSMADILAVLYGGVMRVDPARPDWPERDRFVLSKGHACVAVWAALGLRGFFPEAELETFYQNGTRLAGHITSGAPGVEVSTGSLGHGLSLACGMALAAKRSGAAHRVFALLSDGECDEGSTWEAALFAPHHRLDNLVVVVDYNRIQSLGHVRDVLDLEPLAGKWSAFGWEAEAVDGHDLAALDRALRAAPSTPGRPRCVVAKTVKGKGVSFMEDRLLWHYRSPDDDELARALAEVEGA